MLLFLVRAPQDLVRSGLSRAMPMLVGAAALVLLVASCADDSNGYTKAQITVIAEPNAPYVVDNAPPGPGRGDTYAFLQPLVDESGKPAGRLEGFSVTTDQGARAGQDVEYRAAVAQFTLDKGTIVVSGVYIVPPRQTAPATPVTCF